MQERKSLASVEWIKKEKGKLRCYESDSPHGLVQEKVNICFKIFFLRVWVGKIWNKAGFMSTSFTLYFIHYELKWMRQFKSQLLYQFNSHKYSKHEIQIAAHNTQQIPFAFVFFLFTFSQAPLENLGSTIGIDICIKNTKICETGSLFDFVSFWD